MSKIINDGLDQYGGGPLRTAAIWSSWRWNS